MQLDVHIRLERQQVRHAQNTRVDRRRVLDLKSAYDRAPPQPRHTNLFDRAERGIVVVEWKAFEQGILFVFLFLQDRRAISTGNPYSHAHPRPNAGDECLHPYRLTRLGLRGDDRLIHCCGIVRN